MVNFSYIIGFRNDNSRIINLNCVLKWLEVLKEQFNVKFEIIIVEQDKEKKLCENEVYKHIYIYNQGSYRSD